MNRPWQVWMLYLLCLAIVVVAMGWLSNKALELDDQATHAARQADLEEDISLALWRMDVALAPIVAQEAARPYLVYRPFLSDPLDAGNKGTPSIQVSPILVQPSEFVHLHFELNENGELSSPQCPAGTLQELAVEYGAPRINILSSCGQMAVLSEKISHKPLAAQLPSDTLPPLEVTELAWNNRQNLWNFNPVEDAGASGPNVLVQNDAGAQRYYGPLNEQAQQQQEDDQQQQMSLAQLPAQISQANNADAPNDSEQFNPEMAGPGPDQLAQAGQSDAQQERNADAYAEQYRGNYYGYGRAPRLQNQRGQLEFQRRNKALQSIANSEVVKQRKQLPVEPPKYTVQEGVSAPLWVGGELLLARRVKVDQTNVIQGCWFDWPKLKEFLIAEGIGAVDPGAVALPTFDLRPIVDEANISPARRLATLPVEIVVTPPNIPNAPLSPIRLSLIIAWVCMVLAAGAVAILLQGVVTLSERRGAFVSAVTHELRTPLTTFRMYAEMLSEGMVKDPAQQKQYTDTLRVEADRLSHLVENVLAYARLERGRKGGRREDIAVSSLVSRVDSRLSDRAQQAGMKLEILAEQPVGEAIIHTDPQAVEQILFNLVDNACKYARRAENATIHLNAELHGHAVVLTVRDHGPGISKAFAKRLFQPFSKSAEDAAVSAPGVGLGLALCQRLAREIGGELTLDQTDNNGAAFRLTLPLAR